MKNKIIALFLFCFLLQPIAAHADIWGERHGQPAPFEVGGLKQSSTYKAAPIPSDDILSNLASIIGALGVKEGAYYDIEHNEFVNYAAATLVTFDPVPVSIDLGMLNTDGAALTANYNVGDAIPVENVPVMKFLKYLYLGGGIGARYLEPEDDPSAEKAWEFSYGLSAMFKFVY